MEMGCVSEDLKETGTGTWKVHGRNMEGTWMIQGTQQDEVQRTEQQEQ